MVSHRRLEGFAYPPSLPARGRLTESRLSGTTCHMTKRAARAIRARSPLTGLENDASQAVWRAAGRPVEAVRQTLEEFVQIRKTSPQTRR